MSPTRVISLKNKADADTFDRTDPNCVYVGRYYPGQGSSNWGNPFLVGEHGTHEQVRDLYRQWLAGRDDFPGYRDLWRFKPGRRAWIRANVPTLRGKTLACSCKPDACHGDVLAELAGTHGRVDSPEGANH